MSVLLRGYPLLSGRSSRDSAPISDRDPRFFDRELHIMKSEGQLFVRISLLEGVDSYTVEAHLRSAIQGVSIPECPVALREIVVEALGSFKSTSPVTNETLSKHGIASPISGILDVDFGAVATG